jgi:uncharacterized membrane protein (DUF4010 family)
LESLTLTSAAAALAAALLIGLLIGGQREAAGGEEHPGLRDFLLVTLAGGLCGLLGNGWVAAAALAGISAIFAVLHFEQRERRTGITTELAAIAAFLLAMFAASPQFNVGEAHWGRPLAIGTAVLAVAFLEARQRLHTLLQHVITEQEFNATLLFVAVVLVVYPLLPRGAYGPFQFFAPRQVWRFVMLIQSISYLGYFLEKFLGEERGLFYTSILGGLASTTAVTLDLARRSKQSPEETPGLWRAFVVANTVQFPRAALIVAAVSPEMLRATVVPLAAMMLFGMALEQVLKRWPHKQVTDLKIKPRNPFSIGPALEFGVLFTAVVFASKAATVKLGSGAFLLTSLVGGLVDVATVIAPAADLVSSHQLGLETSAIAVLLALGSNAVLKIALAAITGTAGFALRITLSFALWAAVGAGAFFWAEVWMKI